MRISALLTILVSSASAQPAPANPSDSYAKQLAQATLVEGRGFPGVVELGMATPQMYKAIGPGRESLGMPFWYTYDRGSWQLVVVAETTARGDFTTRAIEISGARTRDQARPAHRRSGRARQAALRCERSVHVQRR